MLICLLERWEELFTDSNFIQSALWWESSAHLRIHLPHPLKAQGSYGCARLTCLSTEEFVGFVSSFFKFKDNILNILTQENDHK